MATIGNLKEINALVSERQLLSSFLDKKLGDRLRLQVLDERYDYNESAHITLMLDKALVLHLSRSRLQTVEALLRGHGIEF